MSTGELITWLSDIFLPSTFIKDADAHAERGPPEPEHLPDARAGVGAAGIFYWKLKSVPGPTSFPGSALGAGVVQTIINVNDLEPEPPVPDHFSWRRKRNHWFVSSHIISLRKQITR